MNPSATILHGDAVDQLRRIRSESVQCVVTSPPYWSLRDYQVDGQIGLEAAIRGMISAGVWPHGWDGTEPIATTPMHETISEGLVQPVFLEMLRSA